MSAGSEDILAGPATTTEDWDQPSAQQPGAPRAGAPGRSPLAVVARLLGGGNTRTGSLVLAVLVAGAVLVPVLLLVLFRVVDGTRGSGLLGLVLGLVVDLLLALLLLGVLSHRTTSQRLREHRRALRTVEARTSGLDRRTVRIETTVRGQGEWLRRDLGRTVATRAGVEAAVRGLGNRLQATHNLFDLVQPRGPVPPMVGYVAAPDVLLVLVQRFLTIRPSLAIECGSGTSTLFLALAAQQHGISTRLVSLENTLAYAEGTRALLAEHGVDHLVEVRHAPLAPTSLPDHDGPWYDPAALADLHDIGLAFVDGPPGDTGPQARYPMVPLLADRLAPRCAILLDDANRREERDVAERWRRQLEGFRYRHLPLTRGADLFERGL